MKNKGISFGIMLSLWLGLMLLWFSATILVADLGKKQFILSGALPQSERPYSSFLPVLSSRAL